MTYGRGRIMTKAEMILEVALEIQRGFPGSEVRLENHGITNTYIIFFEGADLIKVNDVGVYFLSNSSRKSPIKWSHVLEGGPESVARQVHKELKRSGFRVESR
jgi:hypothetical protein